MNDARDFGESLIAALRVARHSKKPGTCTKAVIALRAWYRHEALTTKPELIQEMSAHKLTVYGGAQVVRAASGELAFFSPDKDEMGWTFDFSYVGEWLARFARRRIEEVFYDKARQYLKRQLAEDEQSVMLKQLRKIDELLRNFHNVPWWRRNSSLSSDIKVINSLLWQSGVYDRSVFSQCVRVKGLKFSVLFYNLCARNKEALARRLNEAPNMAPLLAKGLVGKPLRDWREDVQLHTHENVWQDLKSGFMARGGTSQAWKWLSHLGAKWFHHLKFIPDEIKQLNALAELQLGKVPFHRGLAGLVLYSGRFNWDPRYLDVFKAAVLAHQRRKLNVEDFQDYSLIVDYLEHNSDVTTKGATWASLMRKQNKWHAIEVKRRADERRASGLCYGWAPLTPSIIKGDLEAVSLNTSDELWEEGLRMRHCVGTYDEYCYRNRSRIYSIRKGEEHLATMEVRIEHQRWVLTQLYGQQNRRIKSKEIQKFASHVLTQCRKAPELSQSDNLLHNPKERMAPQVEAAAGHDLLELPF